MVTRILTGVALVLLYVVFVPVGLVSRLWRDPLRRRPDPSADSYWIVHQR